MCSYNLVNGIYSCENAHLLNDILKGDWAFPGFVMSDWWATHSSYQAAIAGLDQEQPDSQYFGGARPSRAKRPVAAVSPGQHGASNLARHARLWTLRLSCRSGAAQHQRQRSHRSGSRGTRRGAIEERRCAASARSFDQHENRGDRFARRHCRSLRRRFGASESHWRCGAQRRQTGFARMVFCHLGPILPGERHQSQSARRHRAIRRRHERYIRGRACGWPPMWPSSL